MTLPLKRSLPALAYFDSSVMEAEWEKLWFKQWLYVCRRSDLSESGQYKVIEIGGQQVLLTQNKLGELKAFYKLNLLPGESKTVNLSLDKTSFSFFDNQINKWIVEPGKFEIMIGSSSKDIRLKQIINFIN